MTSPKAAASPVLGSLVTLCAELNRVLDVLVEGVRRVCCRWRWQAGRYGRWRWCHIWFAVTLHRLYGGSPNTCNTVKQRKELRKFCNFMLAMYLLRHLLQQNQLLQNIMGNKKMGLINFSSCFGLSCSS
jgi:hypothetical protein